jgi:hypothetical protein
MGDEMEEEEEEHGDRRVVQRSTVNLRCSQSVRAWGLAITSVIISGETCLRRMSNGEFQDFWQFGRHA